MDNLADERTLDALDFAQVRERVVAATRSERGGTLARALAPLTAFDTVRREQRRTAEIRELVAAADFHVGHAVDTAALTEAAALGRVLAPTDLRAAAEAAAAAAAAFKTTRVRPSDVIGEVTAGYAPVSDLIRAVTDAIDERGSVQDRASPALGRIRRNLAQAHADARDRVGSIARSGNRAIQDSVVTIRDGRFVVPIKAEFAGEFSGIVHDTSSSGQTVFVEPLAALESNNRVRTLRIEEEREIARILEELSRRVGERGAQIEANVEMLARLDVLAAKAALARAMDAVEPVLVDEPDVVVHDGRHPLLGDRAVPQSFSLDDRTRLLVISGPNMGGKTVALKMLGLFVAMTYAGMQIPAADGTTIGRFERVIADIGDEQSIAENTSTFSAHLRRMREILAGADQRTLVLVDEIGGGTEPGAGAALAVAFLERLRGVGARAIVTTHATELKLFAHGADAVSNASVRFDPQSFAPTYQLDVGAPGQSLALPLARSLGIEEAILSRAQELLESRERDYETALAELAQRNAELHSERERIVAERRRVTERERELSEQSAALERERRDVADRAETRMNQALREFVADLQRREDERPARARVTTAHVASLERTLDAMRKDLGISAEPAPVADASAIREGDRVRILSLRQQGDIVEDYGETVLVAMGALKTVVPKGDVRRVGAPAAKAKANATGHAVKLDAATRTVAELDVRGKRFVEAEPIVDRWIDEAMLSGRSTLRLIHGKGTGLLGRGLQSYLRDHPSVASVRYGNADEGDGGVTIVELRG